MTEPMNEEKNGLTEALAREIVDINWVSSYWDGHTPDEVRDFQNQATGYLVRVEQTKALIEAADRMAERFDEWQKEVYGPNSENEATTEYRAARAKLTGANCACRPCVCEHEERCLGCGAKHCELHGAKLDKGEPGK